MNTSARLFALCCASLLVVPGARAVTDTFGTGTGEFSIEFTEVGDAGNAPDTNARGTVPYDYLIGATEITEGQFQKAIENGLQNVRAGAWSPEQPAGFVHWFEAAAFVNFLNQSAGYQPAYNVVWDAGTQTWRMEQWSSAESWGAYGENRFRHRDARYFLPTEDEWYKAAHYKSGSTNAGYWAYPVAQDTAPAPVTSGTNAATAVFSQQLQPSAAAESGGLSAYGTRGQGGNMAEWTESAWDGTNNTPTEARALRGGHWFSASSALASTNRETTSPYYENDMIGFRVAKVTGNLFARRLSVATSGANLPNNAPASSFGGLRPGTTSGTRIYSVRNTGTETLDPVTFAVTGPAAAEFTAVLPADGPLAPGASAEISVSFTPTTGSDRIATINIASADPVNSPFVVNLAGYGITEDFDKDGDGLNDAAEYGMSALGFDFNVAQPDLVESLTGNSTFVPLYNATQVETERIAAYNNGLAAGTNAVVSDPAAYGLYTTNSIMDLNLGGVMLQKNGSEVVVSVQMETTPDLSTQAFTNHGTPVELPPLDMPADKGFLRIRALGPGGPPSPPEAPNPSGLGGGQGPAGAVQP
jgi:sulfatase modifying factor 1